MKTIALLLLLVAPALAAKPGPRPGVTVEKVEQLLAADQPQQALSLAEELVDERGGASTYAVRGDAKRAAGRPIDESIADYREAARLDPSYEGKYEGLITLRDSQINPAKGVGGGVEMKNMSDLMSKSLMFLAVGFVFFMAAQVLLRGRK